MWDQLWVQTCQCFVVSLLQCPVELLLSVNKRYADGIFSTFDSYTQLLKFVNYMNHQHAKIKFTFEIEKKNLSFLDIKICSKSINSPPLYSEILSLVVYLLILIVKYLHHTNMI